MSDINVLWLNFHDEAPAKGYWCYGWLEETLGGFPEHQSFNDGAIVVIPAEYNAPHVDKINAVLELLPWAIVILASDERGLFPVEELLPVKALWVMTPHFEIHKYPPNTNFMGEFYPGHARAAIRNVAWHSQRPYEVGFSGQITHQRREELATEMQAMKGYRMFFNGTKGFAEGLGYHDYYTVLTKSFLAPAPSGPVTLDSFRAYEALESGAIPVLDLNCPKTQNGARYWNAVFGPGHPLPTVSHWSELPEVIAEFSQPRDSNRIFAWWQVYKREMRRRLLADVPGRDPGKVTILIPTSPIPSHPRTAIIDETIRTVRRQHPTAEILIMIDGIRPEQESYRQVYDDYIQQILYAANFHWTNVTPLLFDTHQHQANMTRRALDFVDTDTILFVEHDTPLVEDRPFEWDEMFDLINNDIVDMIRFHYSGHVHPDHEYLFDDRIPVNLDGVWLRRTRQWSQRPHLASTEYYRRILRHYFPLDSNTMIEDRMHSMAKVHPEVNRLALYCPKDPDGHIVRSYHLDGRGTDEKFEMHFGSVDE